MYTDKKRKKESIANTLTGTNNDMEHFFFSYQGREKLGFFLYKKYVSVLMLYEKAQTKKYIISETYVFKNIAY